MGVVRDGAVGTGDPSVDTAVLAAFGDGATSQGDVHEAFVWASAENLPVVFFLQNNQWAISAPVSTQSRTPLYRRAFGYGLPGVRVDGNDVLACLAVTRRALDDARSGNGASLIEAYTYRINPHTTNDDPRRYRTEALTEHWRALDPIARVRGYLEREAGTPSSFFAEVEDEADALAERIRVGVRVLPEPTSHTVFGMVYSDPPRDLLEQRQEFDEFLKAVNG
jgi:pyruvate dehydrogenase E1 component alpha subunit